MKLNGKMLRARRMELGLTSREVARRVNVSQGLIKRVEETGEVGVLQVDTLSAILDALSVALAAVVVRDDTAPNESDAVKSIAGLLLERGSGVEGHEIASALGLTLDEIAPGLEGLDVALRPSGLRLHQSSNGYSIVPVVRAELGSGSERERIRHLSNLNAGDLAYLHLALEGRLPLNTIAATNNGNVALHKLEGAGLVAAEAAGEVTLTEACRLALEG